MRREFPKAVRVAVIRRATRHSVVYCEECKLPAKKFQIDHVRADGLLGEPTIENAKLLCEICYLDKNPRDARDIAEAKRREAFHLGATPAPAREIRSAGFRRTQRVIDRAMSDKLPLPGRRAMFVKGDGNE
jgi:hypothetical protein